MAKQWKKVQGAGDDFAGNVTGKINNVVVGNVYTTSNKPSKTDVGLGNLDNTKFSGGKFIGILAKSDGTAIYDPSTGDFTGKIAGETAADIKAKAQKGNDAKSAVDGTTAITMVGGSLSIGTPASGVYPFSVDTSGNLKIKNDEFQALADGTVNCKGNFTINQDSNGDSKIVLAGDSSGQAEVLVKGANPTFDLGGTTPLGTATLYLRRKLTSNQSRIQFRTGSSGSEFSIGNSNNSGLQTQYAIHHGPLWSSGTAPERALSFDADGKIGMYSNSKTVNGFTFGSDGTNKHVYIKDGGLGIGTTNTNDGTLAVSGNVGIGTNSPSQKLDVYGEIQTDNWIRGWENASNHTYPRYWMNFNSGNPIHRTGDDNKYHKFQDYSGNDVLAIGGASNRVGIGTNSPSELAHISGSGANMRLESTDTNNATFQMYVNGANRMFLQSTASSAVLGANSIPLQIRSSGSSNPILFTTYNSGWIDRMVITKTGLIGIGTISPEKLMHLAQSADDNGIRLSGYDNMANRDADISLDQYGQLNIINNVQSDGLGNAHININTNQGGAVYMHPPLRVGSSGISTQGAVDLKIGGTYDSNIKLLNASGTAVLTVDAGDSNVGIGTTSPSEKLEVSGTVKATSFSGSGANLTNLPTQTIANDAIDSQHYVDRSIDTNHIQHDAIDAQKLKVTGNGSVFQFLRSDADGSFTWATPTDTNTNTTYSISAYDNAPAGGITLTPSSGSATTIEFTDGDLYYDTDGNNIEAKLMDGVVTAGKISSAAVTTAKIQNNAVTPAKANLGWHTQTKIFVPPSEFTINDDNQYGNLGMVDSGGQARVMYSNLEAYNNSLIPSGYKVTHFRINGTGSVGISGNFSTCGIGTTTSCQPPTSIYTNNTYATNPSSGISADDTNGRYFILGWHPSSTSQYLYGAVLTIAKI